LKLMDNIIALHNDLKNKTYRHGGYVAFNISDPKPRNIHKASVRDRLLHHAIYRRLYPFFDKKFISDSYSCRLIKGTHKAMNRFRTFAYKVSKNHTQTCWVLKCDIRKFFATINQQKLLEIMKKHISDRDTVRLISEIVGSFHSSEKGIGLPLGNLTSQLLVNIYMNEFDQWMKHTVKAKYYIRYADDFVILSEDKDYLLELTPKIADFLEERLKLALHPNKVFIKTFASGVDFLGWVHFPDHRILRPVAKKRMFRGIKNRQGKEETIQSYLGLISHGNSKKLELLVTQLTNLRI
jgi:RNA-directed DNA polymerase